MRMLNKFYPLYLLVLGIIPFFVLASMDSWAITNFSYSLSISFFVIFAVMAYVCWIAKR